ncbi:MAG: hypothetical protein HYV27_22055 [Candidatus Hydrogenedentes bacterium]|nr:hypothetical protein [Candidatus Hydrogenedentota bacterium]
MKRCTCRFLRLHFLGVLVGLMAGLLPCLTARAAEEFMEVGVVEDVHNTWSTVRLVNRYLRPVVVATPNYSSSSAPVCVRLRVPDSAECNGSKDYFEIRVDDAGGTTPSGIDVHYLVVEEGFYNSEDHGVTMEAVRMTSTVTDHDGSWTGAALSFSNTYENPVVVGSVQTYNDADFSFFWCRGANQGDPPGATLRVGKHVGEDSDTTRSNEDLGYVVIEEGSGTVEGIDYTAELGGNSIQGVGSSPPYNYSLTGLSSASVAVATQAGVNDANGGWAVLYGATPLSTSTLALAIDEDQAGDSERSHSAEEVGYIVFQQSVPEYTLTLNATSGGTVAGVPSGSTFDSGDVVEVTATPNSGYEFTHWSGNAYGTLNPLSTAMIRSKTITANFALTTYDLETSTTGLGSIGRSANPPYSSGANVTLTANPTSGWEFLRWSGDASGSTNPKVITMNDDLSVSAEFRRLVGSNELTNPGFEDGTLNETAADKYPFAGAWLGPACGSGAISASTSTAYNGSTYSLKHGPIGYEAGADSNCGTTGDNGPAQVKIWNDCSANVSAGATKVTFSGYTEASGLQSGKSVSPILFFMNSSYGYTGMATGSAIAGGTSGWQSFTVTATLPATTAIVACILEITNSSAGATGSVYYDDLRVQYDKTTTRTLSLSGSNGSIVPNYNAPYYDGDVVSLTAVPNANYTFTSWSGDLSGSTNPSNITLNANKSVTASFTQKTARPFYMGFQKFPYDISPGAQEETLALVQEHADIVSMHIENGVPWQEAYDETTYPAAVTDELELLRDGLEEGTEVVLAPVCFSGNRRHIAGYWGGEMAYPWNTRDFGDTEVREAYVNWALYLIDFFDPIYFAHGVECGGYLAFRTEAEWDEFVGFCDYVENAIHAVHPTLPIGVSVALGNWESQQMRQLREFLPDVLPYVDFVGCSSYPYFAYNTGVAKAGDPQYLPINWLTQLQQLAGPGKGIAVLESSLIAEDWDLYLECIETTVTVEASEALQEDYVEKLIDESDELNMEFLIWFNIADYDAFFYNAYAEIQGTSLWRDTGLHDGDLLPRSGLTVWDDALDRPLSLGSGGGARTTLWYDGYEYGTTANTPALIQSLGGYLSVSSGVSLANGVSWTGDNSIRFPNNESWVLAKSTAGYENITVSYRRKTVGFSGNDTFVAGWYDGTNWNVIEVPTGTYDWTEKTVTLPSGANNNANFALIVYPTNTEAGDFAYVDFVSIEADEQ